MQYLALIHANSGPASDAAWTAFFAAAEESGLFRGGSALASGVVLGSPPRQPIADALGGFMRFDADDRAALLALLQRHPVIMQGGSIELFEMPRD